MLAHHLQDVCLSVHHILIFENLFDGDKVVSMFLASLKKVKTGKENANEILCYPVQILDIYWRSNVVKKVVELALP